MGLRAGIYSDPGRNTRSQAYSPTDADLPKGSVAEREVGLYGHIDQDIGLFFETWWFDFIKVDGCGLRAFGADSEKVTSGEYRALSPILDMDFVARSDVPAGAVRADQRRAGAATRRWRSSIAARRRPTSILPPRR